MNLNDCSDLNFPLAPPSGQKFSKLSNDKVSTEVKCKTFMKFTFMLLRWWTLSSGAILWTECQFCIQDFSLSDFFLFCSKWHFLRPRNYVYIQLIYNIKYVYKGNVMMINYVFIKHNFSETCFCLHTCWHVVWSQSLSILEPQSERLPAHNQNKEEEISAWSSTPREGNPSRGGSHTPRPGAWGQLEERTVTVELQQGRD